MSEHEYAKIIAKNLRNIMFDAQKTQADLSRDLKISKATISSWMNGTRIPRMDKIDLLCHYFNVTRQEIMEDETEKQMPSELISVYMSLNRYGQERLLEYAHLLAGNPDFVKRYATSKKVM